MHILHHAATAWLTLAQERQSLLPVFGVPPAQSAAHPAAFEGGPAKRRVELGVLQQVRRSFGNESCYSPELTFMSGGALSGLMLPSSS